MRRDPKRGRQRSPNEADEVPKEVPRVLWARRYGIEKGRPLEGKREESRDKREERIEKR